MLQRLITAQHHTHRYRHAVVSLTELGRVGSQLRAQGVSVDALGLRSLWSAPRVLYQLFRQVRRTHPQIVQTWMYHADLLGGIAARLGGVRNVVWGIRSSAPLRARSLSNMTARACALTSRWIPAVVVCNAEAGRAAHVALGYAEDKMVVIPNGCDLRRFATSPERRAAARNRLGFSVDDIVIGTIGRFDPHKDYPTFIRAAREVLGMDRRVRIVMAGRSLDEHNLQLRQWLGSGVDGGRVMLAGELDNSAPLLAALDVFCLSSLREGFPNVVTEAMAMEVPCVVTAAGDARHIVGDTGLVVEPGDVAGLARALVSVVRSPACDRRALGARARQRVQDLFSMDRNAVAFERLYDAFEHNTREPTFG
jgi:glycosyltransferase involved in cell wall biosynthesis